MLPNLKVSHLKWYKEEEMLFQVKKHAGSSIIDSLISQKHLNLPYKTKWTLNNEMFPNF